MKHRHLCVLSVLVIAFFVCFTAAPSWSAMTCTPNQPESNGAGMWSQLVSWTASSVDGNFTQCSLIYPINGILTWVETDPGSTAPTASYDVTLTDALGLSITVSDRSATATEFTKPTASGSAQAVPVWGRLLLDISNNSEASATGRIRLYWFGKD